MGETTTIALTSGLAIFFATSAVIKAASPASVDELVQSVGLGRVPSWLVVALIVPSELAVAVGLYTNARWAWLLAGALLVVFSSALVVALRRGTHPRCGCLGDLTSTRVGAWSLVRNAALAAGLAATVDTPTSRPLEALPAAALVAVLLFIVPESLQVIGELRRVSLTEVERLRSRLEEL